MHATHAKKSKLLNRNIMDKGVIVLLTIVLIKNSFSLGLKVEAINTEIAMANSSRQKAFEAYQLQAEEEFYQTIAEAKEASADYEERLVQSFVNAEVVPSVKADVTSQNLKSSSSSELAEENGSMKLTESDFELLCEVTYAEAGNQSSEGQTAVAAVILNRLEAGSAEGFKDTLYGVVNQGFSSVKNGKVYVNGNSVTFADVPEGTIADVERAVEGEDPTVEKLLAECNRLNLPADQYALNGARYFYNPNITSNSELQKRAKVKCKVAIGDHIFYGYWDN